MSKQGKKVELIKPVEFAKQKGLPPQMIFGWLKSKPELVVAEGPKQCDPAKLEARYQEYLARKAAKAEAETPVKEKVKAATK